MVEATRTCTEKPERSPVKLYGVNSRPKTSENTIIMPAFLQPTLGQAGENQEILVNSQSLSYCLLIIRLMDLFGRSAINEHVSKNYLNPFSALIVGEGGGGRKEMVGSV